MTTTGTLAGETIELATIAGLELNDRQRGCLDAMLAVREDGAWAASEVSVTLDHPHEESVLAARALAGLLLLDERILWSTHLQVTYRCAFHQFTRLLHRLGDAGHAPADLKACSGNGRERVYRSSTAAQVRFATHRSSSRGLTLDTLIVQEADHWTLRQQAETLPCLVSVAKPQLIRC